MHRSSTATLASTTLRCFAELPRLARLKMLPLWQEWIRRGWVSGEIYTGPWANIGTPADLAALDARLEAESAPVTMNSHMR